MYFANRRPKRSNKSTYDLDATARLWRMSADLVGLVPDARAALDGAT
jgi:hypothetical protein